MALNSEEPQEFVEYPQRGVQWHHRVLRRRLQETVWIVVTPERDVHIKDHNAARLAAMLAHRGYFGGRALAGSCNSPQV